MICIIKTKNNLKICEKTEKVNFTSYKLNVILSRNNNNKPKKV